MKTLEQETKNKVDTLITEYLITKKDNKTTSREQTYKKYPDDVFDEKYTEEKIRKEHLNAMYNSLMYVVYICSIILLGALVIFTFLKY